MRAHMASLGNEFITITLRRMGMYVVLNEITPFPREGDEERKDGECEEERLKPLKCVCTV